MLNLDIPDKLQIKKPPFNETAEMVMQGEITDAVSFAGFLKCNLRANLAPEIKKGI